VRKRLKEAGFEIVHASVERGLVQILARKVVR